MPKGVLGNRETLIDGANEYACQGEQRDFIEERDEPLLEAING